jgi:peptidyl-prolyl cis-trans isomerase SurA
LKQGADKPQFLLSEIYVAVDRPEDETSVHGSAEQIAQQIMQGAMFQTVASQFSQSPSAAGGGDIGWVVQGQLPDELDHVLLDLRPGQIAGPIRAEGGYYILLLRDRREPGGAKPAETQPVAVADPRAPVPLDRFLIPLPANADTTLKNRALALATNVKNQLRSCADLPGIAKQLQGTIHQRLGNMNPQDLNPELRDALAKTAPGEVVEPFFSPAGLELIMRCDGAPAEPGIFQLPSRDQLQQQLVVQQMSLYAKSYLRDLRREAVVYATGAR